MRELIDKYIKGYTSIMDIREKEYTLLQGERQELKRSENELREYLLEMRKI